MDIDDDILGNVKRGRIPVVYLNVKTLYLGHESSGLVSEDVECLLEVTYRQWGWTLIYQGLKLAKESTLLTNYSVRSTLAK